MRIIVVLVVGVLLASCCSTRRAGSSWTAPAAESGGAEAERTSRDEGEGESPRGGADRAAPPPPGVQAVVNTEWEEVALEMLHAAQHSIRVVHFECHQDSTVDKVVHELILAAKRGVDVSVLLEADVEDNEGRVMELTEAGAKAKVDGPKKYTHAKLIVVDGREVLLGSTNLSYKSILDNNETNLRLSGETAGAWFAAYADALWADPAKAPDLTPVSDEGIGLVRTMHDDDYFETVHPMLGDAKQRVYLLVYGFHMNERYPDSDVHKLASALLDAAERGVDVKVILEKSDYNDTLNGMNEKTAGVLADGCVSVRMDPLDTISHAKLLVVDDRAVVGSNNWGHGGLHMYHEVGAVVSRPEVVEKLSSFFGQVWEQSSPVGGKCPGPLR